MHPIHRAAILIVGFFFVLQGLGWLFSPESAAEGLGMPLLDGLGRSTQIGDFASFFVVGGATMLLGAFAMRAELLRVAAAMLGFAAIGRTIAWLLQGARFATFFIAVETAVAVMLLIAARRADFGD